uniref:t-SNARE coiled-coil homology domain-containing protein n=2 Tax=Gongylonema pulchrum TaxID=637853 RepID=A0A183EKW5_9BILA
LEETRRYTVQSLASVAYQVNTLAHALLHTLDLQGDKISNMASQVLNVAEIIAIHKEKVARREIGFLTVNRSVQKQPRVTVIATQTMDFRLEDPLSYTFLVVFKERPQRYQHTPIDYTILDGLGHGAKVSDNRLYVTRVPSAASGGSVNAHYPVFPNYEQLLPKANITATVRFLF